MIALHQQQGGLSLRAFAEQSGLSERHVLNCAKAGRIVGARQDSRSKKWTIYPPAKLVDKSGDVMKRREATAGFDVGFGSHTTDEAAALRLPVHPTEAQAGARSAAVCRMGIPEGGRCTPTTEGKAEGILPSAKPPLTFTRPSCGKPEVYTCPETQSVLRVIREAAARQHREGIHYLRLDGGEFSQLYAALGRERSRIRKLVSRGLAAVGELRISDSVWHKLQAMCQQGRLL